MAVEKIGVQAVFEDQDFNRKITAYNSALLRSQQATEQLALNTRKIQLGDPSAYDDILRLQLEEQDALRELNSLLPGYESARKQATDADREAASQARELVANQREKEAALRSLSQGLMLVGGSMAAAGAAATLLTRNLIAVASRNQELGIVVAQVGFNVGKTAEEMTVYENSIKDMGITTQAARQSLIQMVQANIDLEKSTELARLAQDAAVIGQLDSSQAFGHLITAIQRGETVMLRTLGLNVSFEQSYKDLATQLGKTSAELTEQEKVQARINAVLQAGTNIAGSYEAAMGTAGKQQRSMARYTEELADQMGQALLPAYGSLVSIQTDLLKSFLDLSPEVKNTAAQMLALSGVVLTTGGGLLMFASKLPGIITGLKDFSAALTAITGISLGPLAIGLTAVGVAVGAVLYLNNLNKAREEEAASLIDASKNYSLYIRSLDDANLSSKGLTESLYNQAKAAILAGEAVADVEGRYKDLQHVLADLEDSFQGQLIVNWGTGDDPMIGLKRLVRDMDDFALSTLKNRDLMIEWRLSLGDTDEEAAKFATTMGEFARAEEITRIQADLLGVTTGEMAEDMRRYGAAIRNVQSLNVSDGLRFSADAAKAAAIAYKDLVKETGLTAAQVGILTTQYALSKDEVKEWANNLDDLADALGISKQEAYDVAMVMGLTADEMEGVTEATNDLTTAIKAASKGFSAFFMEVAGGFTSLRDFDVSVSDATASYDDKIKKLGQSAGTELSAIRKKYENSLPDRTTVAERMKMQEDAWDEWGLRFQDIIENDVTEPYLAELETMGYAKPPDMGMKEWAKSLQDALYAGDLGLIDEGAAAWQEHAAAVKTAMDAETQAVNDKVDNQKAIEDAAHAKELEAQEEQRAQILLGMALGMAEQTDELQKWAATQGVFESSLDTAAEAMAMFTNGMVEMDAPLQRLLTGYGVDLQAALLGTAEQAVSNQETILGMSKAMVEGADAEIAKQKELQGELDILLEKREAILFGEPGGDVVPEDAAKSVEDINEEIAALEEKLGIGSPLSDGMKFLNEEFTAMADQYLPGISAALDALGERGTTVANTLGEDFTTAATNILLAWIDGSVIPDLMAGMTDLESRTTTVLSTMAAYWTSYTISSLSSWNKMADDIIADINLIARKLANLPAEVAIDIKLYDPPPVTAEEGVDSFITKLTEIPKQVNVDVDLTMAAGMGAELIEGGANLSEGIIAEIARRTKEAWEKDVENAKEDVRLAYRDLRKAQRHGDRIAANKALDTIARLEAIIEQNPWDVALDYMNDLLTAAKKLASIGNFLARQFEEVRIKPIKDDLDALDDTMGSIRDKIDDLDDEIEDIRDQIDTIDEAWADAWGLPDPNATPVDLLIDRLNAALEAVRQIDEIIENAFDLPSSSRSHIETVADNLTNALAIIREIDDIWEDVFDLPSSSPIERLAGELKDALATVLEIDKILTGVDPNETDVQRSVGRLKEFEGVAANLDDILSDPKKFKMLDAAQIAELEAQRDKALADAEAVRKDLEMQREKAMAEAQAAADELNARQAQAAADAQNAARELARIQKEEQLEAINAAKALAAEKIRLQNKEMLLLQEQQKQAKELLVLEQQRLLLQEKLLWRQSQMVALEEQRARMDILSQQVDLLKLIREYGLDPDDIFKGLSFGVNDDIKLLMDSMTLALARMMDKIQEQLGMHSPSTVMAKIGSQIMAGLAQGIERGASTPTDAMSRSLLRVTSGSGIPSVSQSAVMGQSIHNNNARSVNAPITANIYNGLDQAMLQAMILQTVHRAMRGW